jgi:hypothetical protein
VHQWDSQNPCCCACYRTVAETRAANPPLPPLILGAISGVKAGYVRNRTDTMAAAELALLFPDRFRRAAEPNGRSRASKDPSRTPIRRLG